MKFNRKQKTQLNSKAITAAKISHEPVIQKDNAGELLQYHSPELILIGKAENHIKAFLTGKYHDHYGPYCYEG